LKRVFDRLPGWPWIRTRKKTDDHHDAGATHLDLARESLKELIEDTRLPPGIRDSLAHDYEAVQAMLDKLQHGHLHIAVFGRVSTGKSTLLNALIGEDKFTVSPLHGETKKSAMERWSEIEAAGVFLIDTPGLDEAGGEIREDMAKEVANRSDLVIFVLDSDITDSELQALKTLLAQGRPVVVTLNKSDLYTRQELDSLLQSIREKTTGLAHPDDVLAIAAQPRPQEIIELDDDGNETITMRERKPDITSLRIRLWEIFEAEGKTLAALNASLFAADLSDQVGIRILNARREIGDKLVRTYCVGKGIAVAFNPVPVADLFAAAFIDVGMVMHLSHVYDLPLSVSSALKVGTAGLSTVVTAGAQGAIAYYSTYVVGQIAAEYLAKGKSWGEGGPKTVVQEILDSLDRDTASRSKERNSGKVGFELIQI
jgi:small GTP-binding protein